METLSGLRVMIMNNIPSYEDLKQIKSYKTYDIFFPIIGGYFRLTIKFSGAKINNRVSQKTGTPSQDLISINHFL